MKKNKIYLLYPPISKQERYSSDVGSVGGEQLPLGIYYLAAYLRDKGFEVRVSDAEALHQTTDDIFKQLEEFRPDFVGVSSTTVAFHRALEVTRDIKSSFPDVTTILGGAHITSNVTHAMSSDCFDFGVISEGEVTLIELLNALNDADRCLEEVQGIAFRKKGELIVTQKREYIQCLDDLPFPAYDLIPDLQLYTPPPSNYKTLPVASMITSRGCPYLCTFCDRNIFGRKYRERSAENVFAEIKHLHDEYGVREIAFVDDTFLLNKQRIHDLFDLIKKEGLYFHWNCAAKINNVTFDFLKYLKENGCWSIAFGIESGDEKILEIIKKKITLPKVKEVVSWCNKLKIQTKGFFIIGHPSETLATIDKTIRFACSLKLDSIVVTINTPIPGSQQFEEASRYGRLETHDWSKFNYWSPVFIPDGLNKEILLKKQKEFYMKFYLQPRVLLKFVLSFLGKGGTRRMKSVLGLVGYLLPKKKAIKAA
ncbi:MAG: radical SAM protein [Planctomycetota bacterium]